MIHELANYKNMTGVYKLYNIDDLTDAENEAHTDFFRSFLIEFIERIENNKTFDENRGVFLVPEYKDKARKIGIKLNKLGGFQLMMDIIEALRTYLEDKKHYMYYSTDLSELSYCWSGVGEWQG
jgi:hypothetical protein